MLIFRFLRGLILSIPDGIRGLFRNRYLLRQMIVRDIAQRYRGSMMGLLWSLLTPLLMLAIYTYVFGFVFQARWPIGDGDDKFHFSLLLFSGLIVHGLFSDTVSRAPSLIVSQPNFVKKVVFPLEILPISAIGASLFHTLICIGTLMVFMLITKGAIPWTAPLFPLVLIPMLFHLAGLCWFLASLGVFLRDISQIIGLVMTMVMFTAPIFYPLSAAPVVLRNILFLNPLTVPVEALRAVTIYGTQPDWTMLGWYMVAGVLIAALGHYWFLRTRRAFADVL
ncbi:MAG: ABC transporter permease [Rhodospirillales bacterium]|nr:ABC transporter permease [Rhodospirillales bacterium]